MSRYYSRFRTYLFLPLPRLKTSSNNCLLRAQGHHLFPNVSSTGGMVESSGNSWMKECVVCWYFSHNTGEHRRVSHWFRWECLNTESEGFFLTGKQNAFAFAYAFFGFPFEELGSLMLHKRGIWHHVAAKYTKCGHTFKVNHGAPLELPFSNYRVLLGIHYCIKRMYVQINKGRAEMLFSRSGLLNKIWHMPNYSLMRRPDQKRPLMFCVWVSFLGVFQRGMFHGANEISRLLWLRLWEVMKSHKQAACF